MQRIREQIKMKSINQIAVYHNLLEACNIMRKKSSSEQIKMKWTQEYMFCTSGMDLLWGRNTRRRSFNSESEIFNSEIKWFFFEIGHAKIERSEILAVQIEKKNHLIEELKILLEEMKLCLRVLLPKKQVNSRGTDIFSMFLTRDDPTTWSRIVPWST